MASSRNLVVIAVAAAAGVLGLFALSQRGTPTPSGQPVSSAASGPAPSRVIEASGPMPMPLNAGQWATYQVTQLDRTPLTYTYKVLARRDADVDFELLMMTPKGRTVFQYTVTVPSRSDPSGMKVLKGHMEVPGGGAFDVGENLLTPVSDVFAPHVGPLTLPSLDGTPQEDVVVAAGKFLGAKLAQTRFKTQGKLVTIQGWYHPRVPIFGLVKLQGVDQPQLVYELTAFGESGAVSEFPAGSASAPAASSSR